MVLEIVQGILDLDFVVVRKHLNALSRGYKKEVKPKFSLVDES